MKLHATSKRWLRCTIWGQAVVLTVVLAPVCIAALMLAWRMHGRGAAGAVAVLAAACYFATIFAMVGEHWFAVQRLPLVGMLWAIAFRTGFPLAAVLVLLIHGVPLPKLWIICYLGIFYVICLSTHCGLTYCSVTDAGQPTGRDNPSEQP
jgi:hypothetical protein